MRVAFLWVSIFFLGNHGGAWQDDVNVFAYDPRGQFSREEGFGFLEGASAHMRLARYVVHDEHHGWRAAADGDVALLNFGTQGVLHFGLNVETLVDDQNDINFRLVQVYYQALLGVKWQLGAGVLHVGIRHRCSHGVDGAIRSRILIRNGLTTSYHWLYYRPRFELDVISGLNLYLLGQNNDLSSQQRGNLNALVQTAWQIKGPFWMVIALGTTMELVSKGDFWVYSIASSLAEPRVEPLLGARVAVRVLGASVKSDVGLQFSQMFDNGYGNVANSSNNLSVNLDFAW